jgi:hypothetical protein
VAEPLPPTFIVRSWLSCQLSRLVELETLDQTTRLCDVGRGWDVPNKGDVHTHISVHTGAIKTDVQAECDTSPRRVTGLAVKAHLKARSARYHKYGKVFRTLLPLPALRTLKT